MVLRLDPRLPLVWRSPQSLQFGVDDPPVVLSTVSSAEERMIAALATGVSQSGFDVVARNAGADAAEADLLLKRLMPVLVMEQAPLEAERRVTVAGSGSTARQIGAALAASGITVLMAGSDLDAAREEADLAVVVADFVVDPDYYGVWLRRDQPHLPVVYGDAGARIGPMVEPGSGPCLYCLERHRTDSDPAWPAIASQLWRRRSRLDHGLFATEVAATAARAALGRLERGTPGTAASTRMDATTGVTTEETWHRHPECGCAALPGTATAPVNSTASVPSPTRTAAAPAELS